MAEAVGIGAAAAARRDDYGGDFVETLDALGCDAVVIADDEPSDLYATAPLQEAEASSSKHSADDEYVTARRRRLEQLRSECGSEAEFEMAKSREHWTVVGGPLSSLDLMHVANRQHFQRLLEQDALSATDANPLLLYLRLLGYKISFFVEYGDGELVVGEKIGEGGQAEIFKATLHGKDEYVLKVFKPDFSLADLERHWAFQLRHGRYFDQGSKYENCCVIESGTLLKDGRFAFVMKRYWGDLRKLIDQKMLANNGLGPPFTPRQALNLMIGIAQGMLILHIEDVLHRDLKSSNVLIKNIENILSYDGGYYDKCVVADFESSGGVQGTGFWRAPEVLQLVKYKVRDPNVWKNIWSKKVDVYGYAMTCYEVLTGRIPFADLEGYEYDVVLRGERPLLPNYVDPKIQELLGQCWHRDPLERPTFADIFSILYEYKRKESIK